MMRAAYHRRKFSGTAPDTSALERRLSQAVAGLATQPGPQAERVAGMIGALLDGQGADGVFFSAQADGATTLFWGARMDEALCAVAAGRLDDGEGMLAALSQGNRLARVPGAHLLAALRGLTVSLSLMAAPSGSGTDNAPGPQAGS